MEFETIQGSMLRFSGELNGEDVNLLKMKFRMYISRSEDLSPVWYKVRDTFKKDVSEAFRSEGASIGEHWLGLSKSTIKDRKRKGYPPKPILVRSGDLRDSLTSGNSYTIDNVSKRFWEYGTEIPYAIYHQSRKSRKKLPRRVFLDISNKFKGDLVQSIHRYLKTGTL